MILTKNFFYAFLKTGFFLLIFIISDIGIASVDMLYQLFKPYRVSFSFSNDQTWVSSNLDRGLSIYSEHNIDEDQVEREIKRVCQEKDSGSIAGAECTTRPKSDGNARALYGEESMTFCQSQDKN